MLWWYCAFCGIHVGGELLVGGGSAEGGEGPQDVFATGDTRDIGLYDNPSLATFPGFKTGMTTIFPDDENNEAPH